MTEKDTKQKILESANELFAKHGFAGASIRDIASKAGVNLAAINYHFGGKDNLYWKVFDYNYEVLEQDIEKIGERTKTTVDLATETFRLFLSDGDAILNTFRIFLSDVADIPQEGDFLKCGGRLGPPGEKVFFEKIQNDLGEQMPIEGQMWATKMIFSILVHMGVVVNTKFMKEKAKVSKEDSPEKFEKMVALSVKAHLNYLKESPEEFKQ
ncbi:MAG: TetR/AcrR family transcriptional regulator [Bdellovibrionales bacterium]